jgi:hypothetical protein
MVRTSRLVVRWVGLAVLMTLALPAAAADLEFDMTRHDFGDISHYGKPEVTFTFKNVGDAPVKIKIVRASNSVGRPTAPEEAIAPGESGDILVKARTRFGGPFRVNLEVVEETDGVVAQLVITGNVLDKEDSVKLEK